MPAELLCICPAPGCQKGPKARVTQTRHGCVRQAPARTSRQKLLRLPSRRWRVWCRYIGALQIWPVITTTSMALLLSLAPHQSIDIPFCYPPCIQSVIISLQQHALLHSSSSVLSNQSCLSASFLSSQPAVSCLLSHPNRDSCPADAACLTGGCAAAQTEWGGQSAQRTCSSSSRTPH